MGATMDSDELEFFQRKFTPEFRSEIAAGLLMAAAANDLNQVIEVQCRIPYIADQLLGGHELQKAALTLMRAMDCAGEGKPYAAQWRAIKVAAEELLEAMLADLLRPEIAEGAAA